ncbi:hypothetical protein Liucustia_79 [Acinetobacter phage Liucustia]|nr:hypothetical protein Liucustia_79 [Acinetobacter phage Liucustia]
MSKHVEFGIEEFNKFLEQELYPAVFEFNGACGKDPEKVEDIDDAAEMILNECKRVIEECDETIAAYKARDTKERLDGVVDVYWTSAQLQRLLDVLMVKFPNIIAHMKENYEFDEVLQLNHALGLFPIAITLGQGTILSGHRIALAARRIIANNKQKYTSNIEEALDWEKHRPAGVVLRKYEYNGQEFYCLKRTSDDYVVKPHTFEDVKLGDLV